MQPPRTSTLPGVGPYRTCVDLAAADPIAFLESFGGAARGFWGRGDRWVAWGGELARIRVPLGGDPRFGRVRREARDLLRAFGWDPAADPAGAPPRLFGGFSFLDAGPSDPGWEAFPSAGFVLPRFVLEGRAGTVRLLSDGDAAGSDRLVQHLSRGGWRTASKARAGSGSPAPRSGGSEGHPREPGGSSHGTHEAIRAAGSDADGFRAWGHGVERVLAEIRGGWLQKAVLARILDVRLPQAVDPLRALAFLREENGRAHVFLVEPEPGRVFLGAAPELLARLRGERFEATAVAGSMPRSSDPEMDATLARRLLASTKDRIEHGMTAEEMVEVLGSHLREMSVDQEPRVLSLARIHHLETVIRGRARAGGDILSFVEDLHPTPAVCGRPRAQALELIRQAEPFDRGWYSGPIGWFDAEGDGDFVPALRSAVGGDHDWRLFAGAGIVSGSDPEAEWEETALKFEPALEALRAGSRQEFDPSSPGGAPGGAS